MRFSRQLIIGHAALLFITLVTGTIAVIALRVTISRLEDLTREISADVIDVYRLRFQAEQVVATSRGFLLTGEAETWRHFEAAVERVQASLGSLHERRATHVDVTRIDEAARAYVAAAETAARRRTATGDPRQIVPMLETSVSPARERFEDSIATTLNREKADFDQASYHARILARRTQQVVLLATAVGIGLSIVLAWLSIRKLRGHYERERAATVLARRSSDARDELLAIVSHDLRSPLSAIAMGASLLEERVIDSHAHKHVAVVRNATERMQGLIDQLLDTAAIESETLQLRLERCDVGQILSTVEELFTSRARTAGVQLAVDLEAGFGRDGRSRKGHSGALEPRRERAQIHRGGPAHFLGRVRSPRRDQLRGQR
jgi:signal transduction histidine kinase